MITMRFKTDVYVGQHDTLFAGAMLHSRDGGFEPLAGDTGLELVSHALLHHVQRHGIDEDAGAWLQTYFALAWAERELKK